MNLTKDDMKNQAEPFLRVCIGWNGSAVIAFSRKQSHFWLRGDPFVTDLSC